VDVLPYRLLCRCLAIHTVHIMYNLLLVDSSSARVFTFRPCFAWVTECCAAQASDGARRDAERLEGELRDYRGRAQASNGIRGRQDAINVRCEG
jgi:hypothetical protein